MSTASQKINFKKVCYKKLQYITYLAKYLEQYQHSITWPYYSTITTSVI